MSGNRVKWTEGSHWLLVEMDEQIPLVTVPSLAHTAPLILRWNSDGNSASSGLA